MERWSVRSRALTARHTPASSEEALRGGRTHTGFTGGGGRTQGAQGPPAGRSGASAQAPPLTRAPRGARALKSQTRPPPSNRRLLPALSDDTAFRAGECPLALPTYPHRAAAAPPRRPLHSVASTTSALTFVCHIPVTSPHLSHVSPTSGSTPPPTARPPLPHPSCSSVHAATAFKSFMPRRAHGAVRPCQWCRRWLPLPRLCQGGCGSTPRQS